LSFGKPRLTRPLRAAAPRSFARRPLMKVVEAGLLNDDL
jgi:hypothetical protein